MVGEIKTLQFAEGTAVSAPTDVAAVTVKKDATTAPTVNDDLDSTPPYGPGSLWTDVTNDFMYGCLDGTAGAAVWRRIDNADETAPLSKTTTYTATTSDKVIKVDDSGGDWTLTLYTAVGNAGKELTIVKTNSDPNQVTIDGNASETINGKTSIKLNTQWESLTVVSDGSNWIVRAHSCDTEWASYTLNIGATTTAPTKGTNVRDEARWRRVGDSMEIVYNFEQSDATGAAAGSGTYLYPIPNTSDWTIDTSKLSVSTAGDIMCGHARLSDSASHDAASGLPGLMTTYNTTNMTIIYNFASGGSLDESTDVQTSAAFPLTTAVLTISFHVTLPMTDWEAF